MFESTLTQDFFSLARRDVSEGGSDQIGRDRLSEQRNAASGKKDKSGAIAQLGERLLCTQEVGGSIPPGSTTPFVDVVGTTLPLQTKVSIAGMGRGSLLFNNLDFFLTILSGLTLDFGWALANLKCRICTCR